MAKVISQETFDDVVKENIIEFSMNVTEAKDETIQQFEAQGINLENIIKDLNINEETGEPIITISLTNIKNHLNNTKPLNDIDLIGNLDALENECNISVPHRVLAAKNGAKEIVLQLITNILDSEVPNFNLLRKCLSAKGALINKQPDIFDDQTLLIATKILNKNTNESNIVWEVLRVISRACIMHELNRQNIMNAGTLGYLKPLLKTDEELILKELCAVFRHLILDDDIRVEFGKSHEHARTIAEEVLFDLTILLTKFKDNKDLLCELILTIAALTVRDELCTVVEEAGGLAFILDAMELHSLSVKLTRESLKLLRALAGNDKVKINIIQQGAAPLINDILNKHKDNESLAKIALLCISTLTLRSPENSLAFFEIGIAETIVETLKLHPSNKIVQRNGAWAIRNMVSRCRDQCERFLICGVEEILNTAMTEHASVAEDVKSALRDLGCKVTLKEEWVGTTSIKIAH